MVESSTGGKMVPHQHPIKDAMRAEVVVDPEYPPGHGPEDCPSVLQLAKGDIVYVFDQHLSGWWGGHKEGDETTGWFPESILVSKPLTGGDSIDYDGDDENSRLALERDRRAVASPQGSHRPRQDMTALHEKHDRLAKELVAEQKKVKELEEAVCLEREWKEKYSADVRRLEAEIGRVRAQRDSEKQERERERRERELLERQQETQNSENRNRLEKEASDLCVAIRNSGIEVKRLQEECAQKDEVIQQMQAQVAALQPQLCPQTAQPTLKQSSPIAASKRDQCRPVETSVMSEKSMALPVTPQGLKSTAREDTSRGLCRQASGSITRQLFTQPVPDDPPPSARQMYRHTSEPVQGLPCSSGHSSVPVSAVRLVSGVLPRPSPRGHIQSTTGSVVSTPATPWRSHSHGASASSPRAAKALDDRPAAQVRTIVSEIERRSTSQTPCGVPRNRDGATTPRPRAPLSGANSRAASACAPACSARTPSHGPVVLRGEAVATARGHRQADDPELPYMSPMAADDTNSAPVVFGMSPIAGRPRSDRATVPIRGYHPSPSPQPKVSVQDRIRAFQRFH
jgi:hypothetical protein